MTLAVAKELKGKRGKHPGFEVLLDVECLGPGEEWPGQLHAMMDYAEAGLLLLALAAMARPHWVCKEAYILTWRRSLDPAFKVFYVVLDGVDPADLTRKGFAPAHLDLLQRVGATDAAGIAAAVRKEVPSGSGKLTLFEQLVGKLKEHLKDPSAGALKTIAERLRAPPVPWQPNDPDQLYTGSDDQVGQTVASEPPFLCVSLPAPAPDRATFKQLRTLFPTVVFLIGTGPELTPLGYDVPVVNIEPPVDRARESVEYGRWRTAVKAMRGYSGTSQARTEAESGAGPGRPASRARAILRVTESAPGELTYSAVTGESRTEVRHVLQQGLLDKVLEPVARAGRADVSLRRALSQLRIPRELESRFSEETAAAELREIHELVLELDAGAGRYPWELREAVHGSGPESLSVRCGLVRRTLTPVRRAARREWKGDEAFHALVIADPATDLPPLPEAVREARYVAKLLEVGGFRARLHRSTVRLRVS